MEVALTFGSVGDIITICEVASKLAHAIGVGSKAVGLSVKEYQELRQDLDAFVDILRQTIETYLQCEPSPYLEGLDSATKSVIDQCGFFIQDTLDHVNSRYHESLRVGGSGKKMKDIFKKVEWSVREKDLLQLVRERLQRGILRLSILNALATRKCMRVDNATLRTRIEEVRRLASDTSQSQHAILNLLRDQSKTSESQVEKLDNMSQQLLAQEQWSQDTLDMANDALKGILGIKDMLVQISESLVKNQTLAANPMCFRSLDPTKGSGAILEDALGNEIPISSQLLDILDWKILHYLLTRQFKGRRGYGMVLKRQYSLEESVSGNDLDSSRPLQFCLRRGMKINMSMVFDARATVSGACPRCRASINAPDNVTVQCTMLNCGMSFRMQVNACILEPPTDLVASQSINKPKDTKPNTRLRTSLEPSDFQRVRLLSQRVTSFQQKGQRRREDGYEELLNYLRGNVFSLFEYQGEVEEVVELNPVEN